MVKATAAPLVALVSALILISVAVNQVAPASLLRSPDRPFEGYGNSEVRVESNEYPRYATGADDVRVQVDRPSRRIVSQFSSADEFVYAVIPPERIVGVGVYAYQRRVGNVYGVITLSLRATRNGCFVRPPISCSHHSPRARIFRPSCEPRVFPSIAYTRCSRRWSRSRSTFAWLAT